MATEKRLIRADETVDAFTKWLTSTYDGRMPVDIVNEIPTVDAVEVVHGKWLETGWDNNTGGFYWVCSECNRMISDRYGLYYYCPYCGAKMDGDGND